MTPNIHPASVGSMVWTIFWKPGLDCNLVSAWFGSTLEVLRPVLEASNLEVLSEIFVACRRLSTLVWFGISISRDLRFLDKLYLILNLMMSSLVVLGQDPPGPTWMSLFGLVLSRHFG
jgi:hypothetical protein